MSKMRKIVVFMETGECGTGAVEFLEVPYTYTDDQLADIAWNMAVENAASYGIYPAEDYQDVSDEELEASGETISWDIAGWWEDYSPADHDDMSMDGTPNWSQSAVY